MARKLKSLVVYPITVYTVIGLTTCCILTFEPLQGLSLLRWGPQFQFSNEKGKCVWKPRGGFVQFQNWRLEIYNAKEWIFENVKDDGKAFIIKIRRALTGKMFSVQEGNHIFFESEQ